MANRGEQPGPAIALGTRLGELLNRLGIALAYCGGAIVAGVGMMSAVSIVGRSLLRRPITGDFERCRPRPLTGLMRIGLFSPQRNIGRWPEMGQMRLRRRTSVKV